GEGVHTLSTAGALGGPPVSDDCSAPKEEAILADVFLRYVPSATGIATRSSCGDITVDTRREVYAGLSFTDSLCALSPRFVCSDDAPECAGGGSAVTLPVRHGDCLWVRAGGTGGAQGITALTITLDTCPADLDGRGGVDGADLALLLAAWGDAGPA